MKFLPKTDAEKWVEQNGLAPLSGPSKISKFGRPERAAIPVDSGRRTSIARSVSEIVAGKGSGLLWITEWNVWPSSENLTLFYGYRMSLGETRQLIEVPAHQFNERDLKEIECLLDLILYFSWGAWLITDRLALHISHDEYFDVYSNDQECKSQIISLLEK